ncbi:hypothetical protein JCM10207_002098 [Rhodosporidiobolus poonsookiae]
MPSLDEARSWYLCVDGGGTAVKVALVSSSGEAVSAVGGPCNVKSVGVEAAIAAILAATSTALREAGFVVEEGALPWPRFFDRVWLALAGVLHQRDIDEFAPHAARAFGFAEGDLALRITNDGFLLASPCLAIPEVDSTVGIIAGTGSVGLAFRKTGLELDLVGRSGGWGYLLGDEGSAYTVARLAIARLLTEDDGRVSASLTHPAALALPTLPLFTSLLAHLDVPDAASLIDKTYSDHSSPSAPSFTTAETARKVWIAESARVVFSYAYERADADEASRAMALSILEEAMRPLVETAVRLVGNRKVVDPARAVLALGGGMWKAEGYRRMMVEGLRERGIEFARVRLVESAAEEGARALLAQAEMAS